jgi:hypothetical protein
MDYTKNLRVRDSDSRPMDYKKNLLELRSTNRCSRGGSKVPANAPGKVYKGLRSAALEGRFAPGLPVLLLRLATDR